MKYPWQILSHYYRGPEFPDDTPYYMCRLPGFWFPYTYEPGTFDTIGGGSVYWLNAPWCRT